MSSLEPYQSQYYRAITPPYTGVPYTRNDGRHSRHTSTSTVCSQNSSPESVATHATTPSRSPIRQHGPTLLPKLRTQDSTLKPIARPNVHRRASSQACPQTRTTQLSRPGMQRSTTSPPECVNLVSPVSATSTASPWAATSAISSPVTFTSSYSRKPTGHARSSSTPYNVSTTYRSGTPTFRTRPAYYTNSVNPGASTFVPPPITTYQPSYSSSAYDTSILSDFVYVSEDEPQTSLQKYLTGANPAVNLVERVMNGHGQHSHFWWDIRNLETWDDFNLETIHAVPGLQGLLNVEFRAAALKFPAISPAQLHPSSESALQDTYASFFVPKVSSALKAASGTPAFLSMRADKTRDGPHFIANYQNDYEKTLAGNGRGRVVGIVKSFDRWNTSMRHDKGHRRVQYLAGLAHIHRYMREHSCRYGFIITEIELVCVRLGGNNNNNNNDDDDNIPCFGYLELAPTIELKQQNEGLTACLALWYLHMLAKDEPLPGQLGWRVEIGPPGDVTRSKVKEKKDEWIPEPGIAEKRQAKTIRGWVMPGDPWNRRKEGGRTARALREVRAN
ncbi:MAG: hypothetical protein L6R40_008268 [Gallowayella cf. fulva]|nr:MAG: hypothetical protein L6R40_008268 [Xanthomendoza cf. fulva]